MSEFEGFDAPTPPPEEEKRQGPKPALPDLIRASDLEDEEPEPAELGFEPNQLYRGQQIVDVGPQDPAHEYLFNEATAPTGRVRAFYVISKNGKYGLVPWPGSTIIWPHETAWLQDLYHEKQSPEKQAQFDAFRKAYAAKEKKA